jgi:hypothetical protein
LYDLEIYIIDRVWFMINSGESHTPLALPILEIWIFEILKIRTLKSNNSRSIIVRIFWFAYYCFSCVSEQESILKKAGAFGRPWPKLLILQNHCLQNCWSLPLEVIYTVTVYLISRSVGKEEKNFNTL